MRETLNKLWTAFFVAVLLVVPALVVSGLLGPQAGLTLWMMGIAAHQPVLWAKNNLSSNRRFAIWFSASVVGGVTYLGVEALAASLLSSGNVSSGLRLGFAANLIGVMVAPVAGGVLVRRSSRSRHASSLLTATRQSTQRLERQTSVTCEDVKDEGRTQSGAASVASLRVRATARQRANVALREEKPSTKRGWGLVLFALSLVAAILVASLGKSIGRSMVSLVEHRYGQQGDPHASIERETDYEKVLRLMERGHARVAPMAALSIDALLAEYRENEFAAAAKYENTEPLRIQCLVGDRSDECRVVEIAGTIREMGRDDNGNGYIRLATADQFVSVEARFGKAEHESLQTLRRGERVSVCCMVLYDTTTYRASAGLLLTRCGVAP